LIPGISVLCDSKRRDYHFGMNEANDAALRDYVSRWQTAAPLLRQVRDQDIRNADPAAAMKAFTGRSERAVSLMPPGPTSGLIEQQRWFMKLRAGA
jgi:hypothetical protein